MPLPAGWLFTKRKVAVLLHVLSCLLHLQVAHIAPSVVSAAASRRVFDATPNEKHVAATPKADSPPLATTSAVAEKFGGLNLVSGLWAGVNCSYDQRFSHNDWNCTVHPSNVSFGSEDDIDAVARYHAKMGANSVALTLNGFVRNSGSVGPIYSQVWSPTISQLRAQINAAHVAGMTVMLRPLVAAEFPNPEDKLGNKSAAHDIGFSFSTSDWDLYTANTIAWHKPYLELAQELQV